MTTKRLFVYFFILLFWSDTVTMQPTSNEKNTTLQEEKSRPRNQDRSGSSLLTHHHVQISKKVPPETAGTAGEAGPIFVGAASFEEFVRRSNFWADKSGLILEIIQAHAKVIVLTAARRWGKTMNLNMIQTFLEIPVAKDGRILDLNSTFAYNYFKNGRIDSTFNGMTVQVDPKPVISNFSVDISKHLGKYPVIHINFAQVDTNIHSVKSIIAELFEEYEYLLIPYIKIYNDQASSHLGYSAASILQKYRKIKDMEINEYELIRSIRFLSKLLFEFHGTKVVILIDEYDHFINQLVLPQFDDKKMDQKNLLEFYRNFLIASVKTNIYSERCVLTGIIRIAELTGLSNWEGGSIHVNIIEPNNFNNFYGITKREMEEMLELAKDEKYSSKYRKFLNDENFTVDQIMNYYDGYSTYAEDAVTIFSVLSLAKFINNARLDSYWVESSTVGHFWKLFRFSKFNHTMSTLYDGRTISMPVKMMKDIDVDALNRIYDFIHNHTIPDEFTDEDIRTVFCLLSFMGYATAQKKSLEIDGVSATFQMRLPNLEIKQALFEQWFGIIVVPKIDNLATNISAPDEIYLYKTVLANNMKKTLTESAKSTNATTIRSYLNTTLNIVFKGCKADVFQENINNIMSVWDTSLKSSMFERVLKLWAPFAKFYQSFHSIC